MGDDEPPPVHHGYLVKRSIGRRKLIGSALHNWRKRYIILTPKAVTWHEAAEVTERADGTASVTVTSRQLGSLPIDGSFSLVKDAQHETGKPFTFSLFSPPYMLVLQATSEEEREEWVSEFEAVINALEGAEPAGRSTRSLTINPSAKVVAAPEEEDADPAETKEEAAAAQQAMAENAAAAETLAPELVGIVVGDALVEAAADAAAAAAAAKAEIEEAVQEPVQLVEEKLTFAQKAAAAASGDGSSAKPLPTGRSRKPTFDDVHNVSELKLQKDQFLNTAKGQAQLLRCVKKKVVERELTPYDRFFSPKGFPLEVEELPVVPTKDEKLSECTSELDRSPSPSPSPPSPTLNPRPLHRRWLLGRCQAVPALPARGLHRLPAHVLLHTPSPGQQRLAQHDAQQLP